ncbi:TITAN-like protein isoform X1 [Amborella trichopoda]|uniref:TITAN-like protein isoform X1 n=1 Tax=Amborella trichopoda TaxID=13333 RepID=UPI0005D3557B|nr:TITAN-like protein isoform X1 [Amborella trichopoda]|eukprot:XP_011626937.1 TITAN-like protein isoform X1 [Amborella trichopoda]
MKEKEGKESSTQRFEFCSVCRLNHDQGRRHNYFPSHKSSFSLLLSKFKSKIQDVRFFLKNPSVLKPEDVSCNRFWCVCCEHDINELNSTFACSNAIAHLTSSGHLKVLKSFLWKYGGGMDRVDWLRISQADRERWEKRCCSIMSAKSSSNGSSHASNNIHAELRFVNMDNFEKNSIQSFSITVPNGVRPLQYFTNESFQDSYPADATKFAPSSSDACLPVTVHKKLEGQCIFDPASSIKFLGGEEKIGCTLINNDSQALVDYSQMGGEVQRLPSSAQNGTGVLQHVTKISPSLPEESVLKVQSGTPPPWLEIHELDLKVGKAEVMNNSVSIPNQMRPSHKIRNPKRVGAAWAEKRRAELVKEKSGDVVSSFDADWLPNFGRVWQSGSRKESRKEFENERHKLFKFDSITKESTTLQPYVSKRMRIDPDNRADNG